MLSKYQSVIQFRGMKVNSGHAVLFLLSIRSTKFSNEVLYAKFDFQYFVKEMFK